MKKLEDYIKFIGHTTVNQFSGDKINVYTKRELECIFDAVKKDSYNQAIEDAINSGKASGSSTYCNGSNWMLDKDEILKLKIK